MFASHLIPKGSTVLCALSGGADSMYLLTRLTGIDCTLYAAHFNHQLRPTADKEEEFVRQWCTEHHIPLTVGSADVAAYAKTCGMGIEEAARELRYAFLRKTAAELGCTQIATGHHADDNAETVLMNLIRGCGTNGLAGIPQVSGEVIRPMLEISKAEILHYLADRQIPHVEDESNADPAYTRNRIRQQLIPLLNSINPQASTHIAAAARRAAEDEAELKQQAKALSGCDAQTLLSASKPVALRYLKSIAPKAQAGHLEQMLALCKTGGRLDIPGGQFSVSCGKLCFATAPPESPPPLSLVFGTQTWGNWEIQCERSICPPKAYVSNNLFYLRQADYTIRPRQEGDTLQPGKRPRKTVKKWMIEADIPRTERELTPILADAENRVAAVGTLGPDWDALAEAGTNCYEITFRKKEL